MLVSHLHTFNSKHFYFESQLSIHPRYRTLFLNINLDFFVSFSFGNSQIHLKPALVLDFFSFFFLPKCLHDDFIWPLLQFRPVHSMKSHYLRWQLVRKQSKTQWKYHRLIISKWQWLTMRLKQCLTLVINVRRRVIFTSRRLLHGPELSDRCRGCDKTDASRAFYLRCRLNCSGANQ